MMKKTNFIKKVTAAAAALAMAAAMLTGCGGDPVADEFEQFLNTDMVEINANYDKLKEENSKFENFQTDDEFKDSISNVILPNIADSMDKLSKIQPETAEVKDLKDKYQKVLTTYKDAYETLLESFNTGDEELVTTASNKIDEGVKQLDEYNAALEALAKDKGMEIEY